MRIFHIGGHGLKIGLDIGSVSLCLVVLNDKDLIQKAVYKRHNGDPLACAADEIAKIYQEFGKIDRCGFTGNGALQLAKALSVPFLNEFSALTSAVVRLIPTAQTVFEMGGQQAKYIHLAIDSAGNAKSLDDFAASGLCAAGTGSFLDQQANRIGIDIETEFGQMAVQSVNPPHIAGRCSVFAKSDMIHNQQRGVPVSDIIAGLCYAVARNFKGTIAKSKRLDKPVVFLGGVASNPGVVKAFKDIFDLTDSDLIVPEWHKYAGAIGAALLASEYELDIDPFRQQCREAREIAAADMPRTSPLSYAFPESKYYEKTLREEKPRREIRSGYLGIDIGSLSTNVVLISEDCEVISRRYLMTAGRPIEVMQRGLREIREEIAPDFEILGVATTGSGRYLIGELVGADIIRNEITAQATGGSYFVPDVDTIFEIGGQDSKYISLENGAVVDFEMNRACAAGTGSFLEEQAERLAINIKKQFADLAFEAPKPVSCGERCTVFMESDLVRYEQCGASKEEITAGLALAVVHNYLNKVVGRKRIGKKILFQGGVAWNKAVVAAFETVVGQEIIVPPHHDITGAIGAAILVRNARLERTNFKGFDLALRKIAQETFLCEDCANMCNITRVVDSGRELYYGSRCEKYDAKKSEKVEAVNLVTIRNRKFFVSSGRSKKPRPLTVGLPRALSNWEYYHLWRRFFGELGLKVVVSKSSSGNIIQQGVESVGSETCFPVKVAHGHLLDLAKRKLDFIFLPSVITGLENPPRGTSNYYCPYVQSLPYLISATLGESYSLNLVSPMIRFGDEPVKIAETLYKALKKYGLREREIRDALLSAMRQYEEFRINMIEEGKKQLATISAEKPGTLLVGRQYNSLDAGVSMDIAKKLTDLGVVVVPMEMAPMPSDDYGFIYWQSGRRILRAAKFARQTPNLYPVYISNFGCGPDSFILHHFKRVMGDKPHLILELDEHSADAGLITRCEAFLDSLPKGDKAFPAPAIQTHSNGYKRKLLIPRMCDHADVFSAALRSCGLDSAVLDETDSRSLELGRKYTGGRECYPAVLTTGDLLRELEKPEVEPNRIAFFMPTSGGPCRFGQYQYLHQQILDGLGYANVPVYSPTSDNSYSNFPETGKSFRRLAWRGFVAADFIRKFLLKTRPYENERGAADRIYYRYMAEATLDVEHGGHHLPEILEAAFGANQKIINPRIAKKPRVGVIGEIYIRNNRYSNNNLIIKLEALGLEADLASFTEWIHYTTDEYRTESLRKRSLRGMLGAAIQNYLQTKDEHWVLDYIYDNLDGHLERPIRDIIENAAPYLPLAVGGEAMPAMGKAIDMIKHGCVGVVNTLPFTCMPGNIINAISAKIARDYGNIPWINMAYEGASGENDMVRLGAFAESVKAWGETKK
jgi:predicted CoA-substrate-specific enzyme activase